MFSVLFRNNFTDAFIGLHPKSNFGTTGMNQLTWFDEVFNASLYTKFGAEQPPSNMKKDSCVIMKMDKGWTWKVVTDCKMKRDFVCSAPVRQENLTDWFGQCPYGYRPVHIISFHKLWKWTKPQKRWLTPSQIKILISMDKNIHTFNTILKSLISLYCKFSPRKGVRKSLTHFCNVYTPRSLVNPSQNNNVQ